MCTQSPNTHVLTRISTKPCSSLYDLTVPYRNQCNCRKAINPTTISRVTMHHLTPMPPVQSFFSAHNQATNFSIKPPNRTPSCINHSDNIAQINDRTSATNDSFFPHAIRLWNLLPDKHCCYTLFVSQKAGILLQFHSITND